MCHYNGITKIFVYDEDAPNKVSPFGGPIHLSLSSTNPWYNAWTLGFWYQSLFIGDHVPTKEIIISDEDLQRLDKATRDEVEIWIKYIRRSKKFKDEQGR